MTQQEKVMSIDYLLDNDGYPSDEWLEFVREYVPDESLPIMEFVKLLEMGWWMPSWGYKLKSGKYTTLELHTGGWSGNEEVISALFENTNVIGKSLIRYMTEVGGHYYFLIGVK